MSSYILFRKWCSQGIMKMPEHWLSLLCHALLFHTGQCYAFVHILRASVHICTLTGTQIGTFYTFDHLWWEGISWMYLYKATNKERHSSFVAWRIPNKFYHLMKFNWQNMTVLITFSRCTTFIIIMSLLGGSTALSMKLSVYSHDYLFFVKLSEMSASSLKKQTHLYGDYIWSLQWLT